MINKSDGGEMDMRIACIDDEKAQREYISKLCDKWAGDRAEEIRFSEFSNAEEFLFKHDTYPYDLLLIDISMGKINGLELSQKVRSKDEIINLAFITGDKEYAVDGYEVGVVRYIIKPIKTEQLFKLLDIVSDKISVPGKSSNEASIIIEFDAMKKAILLKNIVYIEACGHYSEIHMTDGKIYTLKESFKSITDRAMCELCHRSYSVNMSYVESIRKSECILKNEIELPISRGCFESLNKAFIEKYRPEESWD